MNKISSAKLYFGFAKELYTKEIYTFLKADCGLLEFKHFFLFNYDHSFLKIVGLT